MHFDPVLFVNTIFDNGLLAGVLLLIGYFANRNVIGGADFEGWMETRAAGLPNGFDSRYDSPLSIGAAKDAATSGALLIARVGSSGACTKPE
jgi:hypothetical protein